MEPACYEEALRLAGWLLAHQADLATKGGGVPLPLAIFADDGMESPRLVAPRTDSDSYELQVIAGRIIISDQGSRLRSWALAWDEDLGSSGRALLVEAGGRGLGHPVTFSQRYITGGEQELRLVGDLDLLGEELLPPAVREILESRPWLPLVAEGAASHDEAGQAWVARYSRRDHGRSCLGIGGFSLLVPEGWAFRASENGNGWVMMRLCPWEHREYEPTILTLLASWPDHADLEDVIESQKAMQRSSGGEVLREEIFTLPSPALPSKAGRLAWNGEREGRSYRTEWVWVPTDVAGSFLLLCATSMSPESRDIVDRALEAVLASLDLPQGGSGTKPGGANGSVWAALRKLWRR
jgi:hypothetical protein